MRLLKTEKTRTLLVTQNKSNDGRIVTVTAGISLVSGLGKRLSPHILSVRSHISFSAPKGDVGHLQPQKSVGY